MEHGYETLTKYVSEAPTARVFSYQRNVEVKSQYSNHCYDVDPPSTKQSSSTSCMSTCPTKPSKSHRRNHKPQTTSYTHEN